MTALSLIQDGLVAFVKRECPTCALIEPQMREVARKLPQFQVVSQDDPRFPAGVDRLVDDRELDHSWLNNIESTPLKRPRTRPPQSLQGLTIGLFDIGKTRSDEFLNQMEARLVERKLKVRRYAKSTNAKVAPEEVIQKVVTEADVVLIALSD